MPCPDSPLGPVVSDNVPFLTPACVIPAKAGILMRVLRLWYIHGPLNAVVSLEPASWERQFPHWQTAYYDPGKILSRLRLDISFLTRYFYALKSLRRAKVLQQLTVFAAMCANGDIGAPTSSNFTPESTPGQSIIHRIHKIQFCLLEEQKGTGKAEKRRGLVLGQIRD